MPIRKPQVFAGERMPLGVAAMCHLDTSHKLQLSLSSAVLYAFHVHACCMVWVCCGWGVGDLYAVHVVYFPFLCAWKLPAVAYASMVCVRANPDCAMYVRSERGRCRRGCASVTPFRTLYREPVLGEGRRSLRSETKRDNERKETRKKKERGERPRWMRMGRVS
eukprot:GHVU01209916.1.p1 GENE.GHVU01209916.1~~GHVU01209916.1.p1  ORF type:complete len:164 (-),score=4.46 GHVU01209916.1:454-945(-)